MNRVFKVIWCEALNAYVVAGEFAKGRTKSASIRKLMAVLVAAGMLGAGFVNSVDAAASKGSQQITITDKDTTGTATEIKTIFYIESEWPSNPYPAGGYSSISSLVLVMLPIITIKLYRQEPLGKVQIIFRLGYLLTLAMH